MKKIMVVDDSPVDSQHLVRILREAGCMVIAATSGLDALAKVKADKPDLIMMDVNMPDLDGFATTRKLQQEAETKSIPVIFVTGKDQKADRVFAQMLGAKGYVTKPYSTDQILAQI